MVSSFRDGNASRRPLKKALEELKHASVIKIHQEKGFICLRGRLLTRYIVSQSQNRHEV